MTKYTVKVSVSEREVMIAQMLSNDKRPKEIAPELKISNRTVEAIIDRLRGRFGCLTVTGLIAEMMRQKIID